MTPTAPPAPLAHRLDEGDRKELLRIARATLREFLTTGYLPPGAPHRKPLLVPGGAFVSVHVGGELRGCMGRVEADRPLYLAVEELAVAAATRDPRFEPLRIEELRDARLEISLLSPLEPGSIERIEVGRHGLVVTRGPRRGLLLPKVAVEHGWDREQFLDETCGKAGLPPGAWKDPETRLELFTAEVFADPEAE
ncbi:MAG TPA: AmmeMemoRadiSam system protein A [Polyangia bacterium]|nr:AmmeMemoRadiSam system protein A [Polyangia bacterium]